MTGRTLTKAEQNEWRIRLEEAMPPDNMERLVNDLQGVLRGHMLVQAGLAFVRDAWTASRFAQARGADAVRLWPEIRPDCELILQGRRELFEIVEADQPGRRRSAEYKAMLSLREDGDLLCEDDPVEDWIARSANAPQMLRDAATKKAGKGYDLAVSLLIYLNLGEYGVRQREIETAMQSCTAPAKDAFHEVWVLWKAKAYPVWRRGELVPMDTWPKTVDEEGNDLLTDAALWTSITGEE